jgi:hypothetical protein
MASLPNSWNYNDPPLIPLVSKIGNLANNLYSKYIPHAGAGIVRFLSLYLFILRNLDVQPAVLRTRIVSDGRPIFTLEQMRANMETIQSQRDSPLARRLLGQVGGQKTEAPATSTSNNAPSAATAASATSNKAAEPVDDNPSRSKFWDIVIQNQIATASKYIPPTFNSLIPVIFVLYGLEQLELVGPLISTFLDSITLGLPILGELLGSTVATFISVAPVPYAGVVADVAAHLISMIFISISAVMSVSRKQFGTSFTVGLGALPLVGEQLSDAALLFEKQFERYEYNKKKILASVDKVSPHVAEVIDYWTPEKTELIKSGPPVLFDTDELILDVLEKSIAERGPEQTLSILGDTSGLPPAGVKMLAAATNKKGGRRYTRRIKRKLK